MAMNSVEKLLGSMPDGVCQDPVECIKMDIQKMTPEECKDWMGRFVDYYLGQLEDKAIITPNAWVLAKLKGLDLQITTIDKVSEIASIKIRSLLPENRHIVNAIISREILDNIIGKEFMVKCDEYLK